MDKHDLLHDFPEHKEKIHELKVSDTHFRSLFDKYHALTADIYRLETEGVPTSDETLTELRKNRVHLKDELYNYLQ